MAKLPQVAERMHFIGQLPSMSETIGGVTTAFWIEL